MPDPRYSVVVPTYQRRDGVARTVRALSELRGPAFEVVVVVDGSTDGTAAMLRGLAPPFPLRVIEQANRGAAAARNRGAAAAVGEVLLFLDDDMHAAPDLLLAHERAHAAGADAVLGHIPLHPDSPPSFLAAGVGEWAEKRAGRLAERAELTPADLLTGQMSVRADVFGALGGFDEVYTEAGTFGGEDTDFGARLLDGGYRVIFAPDAVSAQLYAVTPAQYLRQWHQAGRSDVRYVRRHPADAEHIRQMHHADRRWVRFVVTPLVTVPVVGTVAAALGRAAALAAVRLAPDHARATKLFFRVRDLEYWRGARRAGGLPRRRQARVLCYHALSDLAGAPVLAEYGVPGPAFRRQLRWLRRAGCTFVTPQELLRSVRDGAGLPRRPVLVTFDDCVDDLLTTGAAVLRSEGVPAVAFAVADLVGGTNVWDAPNGAPALRLLDAAELRSLEASGVEIGAHGATHAAMTTLPPEALAHETAGAGRHLAAAGVRPPRLFAYPYGDHDERVRAAVAEHYSAAFTVEPARITSATTAFALPRIEVLRRHGSGLRFLAVVLLAGRHRKLRARIARLARAVRSGDARADPDRWSGGGPAHRPRHPDDADQHQH